MQTTTLIPCQSDILNVLKNQTATVVLIDCGLMPYTEALELQFTLNREVLEGTIPSVCLFIEHPPVITLGIHKEHNMIVANEDELRREGIECVPIRRGGGSTAHNPGQLVIYPIMSLPNLGFRVAPFVHYLEQIGMDVLAHADVISSRKNRYPGLWVGDKKIASVGVQIMKGVSMHGIAINLCNKLDIFNYIVPCGIDGVVMTSVLQELGACPPMEELKILAAKSCIQHLPSERTGQKDTMEGTT